MSGYTEQETAERYKGGKPDAFLQKPFTAQEVVAAVFKSLPADSRIGAADIS
jgi:hypothetical protein